MKLTTADDFHFIIEEVYNNLELRIDNENMWVVMRDGAFEIHYAGKWYTLKDGKLQKRFLCKEKDNDQSKEILGEESQTSG